VLAARLPGGTVNGATSLGAFRTVFRVGALVALLGGFAAQIIRDSDAAASMRPRAKKTSTAAELPQPA
jgi:hypothetical protein